MLENNRDSSSIVKVLCSSCHKNTIYIKFLNPKTNEKPFKPKDHICTECNQGLMPDDAKNID